jgi:anti-anti-sigma factor
MTRARADSNEQNVPSGLRFEFRDADGTLVIEIVGEASVWNDAEMHAALLKLGAASAREVVLDFGRVTSMSSIGLGWILSCRKSVQARGGHVRIARPPEQIEQVLRLARLNEIAPIYPTIEAALAEAARAR